MESEIGNLTHMCKTELLEIACDDTFPDICADQLLPFFLFTALAALLLHYRQISSSGSGENRVRDRVKFSWLKK